MDNSQQISIGAYIENARHRGDDNKYKPELEAALDRERYRQWKWLKAQGLGLLVDEFIEGEEHDNDFADPHSYYQAVLKAQQRKHRIAQAQEFSLEYTYQQLYSTQDDLLGPNFGLYLGYRPGASYDLSVDNYNYQTLGYLYATYRQLLVYNFTELPYMSGLAYPYYAFDPDYELKLRAPLFKAKHALDDPYFNRQDNEQYLSLRYKEDMVFESLWTFNRFLTVPRLCFVLDRHNLALMPLSKNLARVLAHNKLGTFIEPDVLKLKIGSNDPLPEHCQQILQQCLNLPEDPKGLNMVITTNNKVELKIYLDKSLFLSYDYAIPQDLLNYCPQDLSNHAMSYYYEQSPSQANDFVAQDNQQVLQRFEDFSYQLSQHIYRLRKLLPLTNIEIGPIIFDFTTLTR